MSNALATQFKTKKLTALEADAVMYERHNEQRKAYKAINELLENRNNWSLEDVNSAVTWAKQGSLSGLDDERVCQVDLDGPAVIKELLGAIEEFQKGEAKRRVLDKNMKKKEATEKRMQSRREAVKDLKECRRNIVKLESTTFVEAIERPDLNGEVCLEPSLLDQLNKTKEALQVANKAEAALTTNDEEYTDSVHNNFFVIIETLSAKISTFQKAINNEISRRRGLENDAHKIRLEILEEERKKVAEVEAKKQAEIQKYRDRTTQAQEERKKAQIELSTLENDKRKLVSEAAAMEREIERIIENSADRLEAEEAIKELRTGYKAKMLENEKKERELKELQLKQQQEQEEQRRIQKENEERTRMEMMRMQEIKNARNQQLSLVAQDENDKLKKQQLAQAKIDFMNRERALIEAGEDDSEEEKQMRWNAKRMIAKYDGDVWKSVRESNFEITRAFLIVHGTKMLSMHSKGELDGSRTLVHAAAFFGCPKLLRYLISLGADVNVIDTSALKTTPLMEATRTGRTECVEMLLEAGANLKAQDCSGDTAAHIAARAGRGGMIVIMINAAEKINPQSSNGFLLIQNGKKKLAKDIAKNDITRKIIDIATEQEKKRREEKSKTANRFKKGVVKAKVLGNQAGESALNKIKAKKKRYGEKL